MIAQLLLSYSSKTWLVHLQIDGTLHAIQIEAVISIKLVEHSYLPEM
jgi:hypothetical protein